MTKPARPDTEEERLAALYALNILDTEREEAYDRLIRLASNLLQAPYAVMSLIDRDRQFLKSWFGGESVEVSRDDAFCSHTILESKPLVVPDAKRDKRFSDNPFVQGEPHIRFYAGVPIASMEGHRLGAVCIYDVKPRNLSSSDIVVLSDIALTVQDVVRSHESRRKSFRQLMRKYHDTLTVR